jgi:hypothetical protein
MKNVIFSWLPSRDLNHVQSGVFGKNESILNCSIIAKPVGPLFTHGPSVPSTSPWSKSRPTRGRTDPAGSSSKQQQRPKELELPPVTVNPSNRAVSSFSREKNTTDLKQRRLEDFYFLL